MFLGGKKKGWMTGQLLPTDRQLIQSTPKFDPTVPSLGSEGTSSCNLPLVNSTIQSCLRPKNTPAIVALSLKHSPSKTSPSLVTVGDFQRSKPQNPSADAVLPSPAPSDEPQQTNIHIIDLEQEEEHVIIGEGQPLKAQLIQEQRNVTRETCTADGQAKRLDNITATGTNESDGRSNEIGDVRRQSLSREVSSPSGQGALTRDRSPGTPGIASANTINKRMMENEDTSNKRLQKMPGTSSVDSVQPSPHISNAIETNPVANADNFSPSETDMQQLKRRIASRLQFVRSAHASRGSVEDGRLLLLRDACECADHDYLLLHQLHCMRSRDSGSIRSFSARGFGEQHIQGLHMLDQLIRTNTELVYDAVEWFSNFPLPNRELLERYRAYQLSYGRVLKCLENLAEFWPRLRALCQERHYAPLVDELNALDLRSVVLQRVISRAILRNIWLLPQDQCFHSSEQLFLINQQDVYQRDTQAATSPACTEANKKAYNQNLIISYLRLWGQHQAHHNQYQQNCQASDGRSFQHTMPPEASQRRLSQQDQTRTVPTRSAKSNHLRLIDQPRRPYGLQENGDADRRSTQNTSSSTPALPSSAFPGLQMSPISWSRSSAERRSSSSSFPPPGVIVPSNREPTGTVPGPVGHPSYASIPTAINGRLPNQHLRTNLSTSSVPAASSPTQSSEGRMKSTLPEPDLDSYPARTVAWTERPPRRSLAALPSSPQEFQVSDTHSQQTGTWQQFAIHDQIHSRHPSLNQASGPLDLHAQTQRLQRQSPYIMAPQFLPPPGYIQETSTHANPVESALHQSHVRSPFLKAASAGGELHSNIKYFQYMWGLAVMPNRLHVQKRHVRWTFTVSKESVQLLARTSKESDGSLPIRNITVGSRLCRIRCIQVSDIRKDISENDWAVAENAWPRNVAIIMNGTALEIRRKRHHGKDLPIDVTQYIQEGQNTLSIATMWLPQDNNAFYTIGLETLQVTTDRKVKEDIATIEGSEAQRRIIERANKLDPDVQVMDPSITLDVTDPYTSSIFEIPVRGKSCRHNQCFDLDVFLQTRASKTPSEPCGPDQFRCPLCGGDARPENLVIDGFFREVREELSRINRLDARAIVLQEGGDWQIKEVEETGESGYGTGRRLSRAEELLAGRARNGSIHMEHEVIEIDDE